MSFDIVFYYNTSEVNAVSKHINQTGIARNGVLREESSVIDPVVIVDAPANVVINSNYAQIAQFNRHYFITNVESVNNGLWRVSMHVDVLYTYRNQIRNNSAIIERNENDYDLKLNDGLFKTQQNPRIAQIPFTSGFNQFDFVLAIAGN